MVKLVNRAKMTTSTTGTGTITLGSASDGYQTFAAAGVSNGDEVRYTVEDGNAWEIGTGTYTASGTTLSRTVSESSNSDNALNLSGNAVVFVTAIADDVGARTYATISDMTSSTSASEGDMAFVTGTNGLFIKKTAGWYKIAEVENNQLHTVTVTMTGGGSVDGSDYLLALDGTDTTATGAATDPEGLSVTWSVAAISPATLSGNNIVVSSVNVATITQGTGASSNVFTIDPVATSGTHNFSLRFSVTDGINATINTDKSYILNFVTSVADSNHTTLLAQAAGSGTNSSFDDASNNHIITAVGNATAGTFSPYRSGGYSAYFTGSAGDRLTVSNQASNWSDTGTATIEFWFHSTRTPSTDDGDGLGAFWGDVQSVTAARFDIETSSNDLEFRSWSDAAGNGAQTATIKSALTSDTWYHLAAVKNGQVWKFYLNGVLELTHTQSTTYNYGSYNAANYHNHVIGQTRNAVSFQGYITDVRVNSNEVYTTAFPNSVPTERLTADSNTTFFYNGTGYIGDTHSSTASNNESITIGGNVEARPFGPYDYSEYDSADHGGSVYFDGSGDYLQLANSSDFNLGSTWTIKGWIYPDEVSTGTQYGVLANRGSISRGFSVLLNYSSGWRLRILTYNSSGTLTNSYGTAGTISSDAWNYIEINYASGTLTIKVNGSQDTSASIDQIGATTQTLLVGSDKDGSNNPSKNFKGYISDLQIINGSVSGETTVPTAPMSSVANTKLFIKGTDASILDKAQSNTFELSNNISPTSVLTSSSTPAYIGANWANNRAISFGNSSGNSARTKSFLPINQGSYTVEGWINLNSSSGTHTFFDTRLFDPSTNSNAGFYMMWRTDSGNYFRVGSGDGVYLNNIGSGDSLSTGTWYHFALVRDASQSSNNTAFFIGGIRKSQMHDTRNKTSDQATIGSNYSNSSIMDGYLQDFRVSHKARYDVTSADVSSNIPTAPLEG